jgi:superfamily II DNA or RNA helicase
MTARLTYHGLLVPYSYIRERLRGAKRDLFTDFTSRLTLKDKREDSNKVIKLYAMVEMEGERYLRVPRGLISSLLRNKLINNVSVEIGGILPLVQIPSVNLYDNQEVIMNHLKNNIFTETRISNGTATCILNMRAGLGKTFIGAGLISYLGCRTLWVTTKKPLAIQTVKDLQFCFSGMSDVGLYSKKKALHEITIIVINSAIKLNPEVFMGFSLMILDEVHSYCTDLRKQIFQRAVPAVLGMSATTEDRGDGFDPISHKELAPDGIIRAETLPGFTSIDVAFDCTLEVINYYGPEEYTRNLTHPSTGKVFTHYMHNQYIQDPYRLSIFVDKLIEYYDWALPVIDETGQETTLRHGIYIFAEEVNILKQARESFVERLNSRQRNDIANNITIEDSGAEIFTGGLKEKEIERITSSARVLFSTYAYASTGVSINKMSVIMLLTPRKAGMKQTFARILRRGSDQRIPRIVVDVVDKKTALGRQATKRQEAYDFYGFKVVVKKVRYSDLEYRAY